MPLAATDREQEILREAVDLLVRTCSPQRIYLFGSRATQQAEPQSDFDFAVAGAALPPHKRVQLNASLEAIAGLYSVNVVFLEEVEAGFRQIVLDTGKVLYEYA